MARHRHFTSHRRHNPVHYRHFRRRRHNPMGFDGGIVKKVAWGVGGGIATTAIPKLVLGTKDTGVMRNIAEVVTASVTGWAITRFVGKEAGEAALLGGLALAGGRLFNEFLGPRIGLSYGLGLYNDTYFPIPTSSRGLLQTTDAPMLRAAVAASAAQSAGLGAIAGKVARFRGRFSN
jgi:hypothetical protein